MPNFLNPLQFCVNKLVLLDFLSSMSKGPMVVDMFCRIFNALDNELISLDYPRNSEEITIAGRIKDAMRE